MEPLKTLMTIGNLQLHIVLFIYRGLVLQFFLNDPFLMIVTRKMSRIFHHLHLIRVVDLVFLHHYLTQH